MARRKFTPLVFENIEVTGAGAKGKAIAHAPDGRTLFIRGAVPGDVVHVRTVKKRKSYYEAIPVEFVKLSDERTQVVCEHFEHCGGCQWQNMRYERQLYYKQKEVEENLKRIGKLSLLEVDPILPAEDIFAYRNKMEFSFAPKRWLTPVEIQSGETFDDIPACGFHIAGMWNKILDIDTCHLQAEPSNEIRNFIKEKALELGMDFYNPVDRSGNLRSLMLRNTTTGEWMALLQFAEKTPLNDQLLDLVAEQFPILTSLLYVINDKANDTLYDLTVHTHSGRDYIVEKLGDLSFRIQAKSFFQTHTHQAKKLYDIVVEYAGLTGKETVYDLYSGAGSIALYLSRYAARVIGVESVKEAVEDAWENARINGVENVEFITGDMRDVFDENLWNPYGKPEIIIVDPPRAGMHPKVVQRLLEVGSDRIVYVSCNSATQARDLALLDEKYKLTRMQPVDMFPHTHHVENVVLLELRME